MYVTASDTEGKGQRSVPNEAETVDRLEFRFADGTVQTIKTSDFPANVILAATWHGLSQKIGDSYASSKDVTECATKASERIADLKDGNWITEAEGGAARPTLLAEAIVRATADSANPISLEQATEVVSGWDTDTRKEAQSDPSVAAALATIKAERAAEAAKKANKAAKDAAKDGNESGGIGALFAAASGDAA
jgi:hypothetical protein